MKRASWLLISLPLTAWTDPVLSQQIGSAHMPRDLSPWSMFLGADHVVKAIMLGLAFASVVTWTVWLAKRIELWQALREGRAALRILQQAASVDDALVHFKDGRRPFAHLIRAAADELQNGTASNPDGLKERVALLLSRIEVSAIRRIGRGLGVVASIGATAPFVGLFGTVWGIMNSFIGISNAKTTNLAVVAPGIAEALLATALGLVAAIPAVVIYNGFARLIGGYRALVADASTLTLCLVSRHLDRESRRLVCDVLRNDGKGEKRCFASDWS